jgi:hypothetical protein
MKRMLVTACLVLALAGCGGGEQTPTPQPAPPAQPAPTLPDPTDGTITDLPPGAPGETATD